MEPIDPRISPELVPVGSHPVIKGVNQAHVLPLPSIHTPSGTVITRWALSDAERRRIFAGDDIFVAIRTYNQPLQPLIVSVGACDYRDE